jgi:hypothetical protein
MVDDVIPQSNTQMCRVESLNYVESLNIKIPKGQEESTIHPPNHTKSYASPPLSAYSPSAQNQAHEFTFSTPIPEALKLQGMQDTPISIQLFVDDTQIQRMLLFPTISFKKVEELIQVKCEKYFERKIEIGMICYVESKNGDLVRVLKEEDWLECKYDVRRGSNQSQNGSEILLCIFSTDLSPHKMVDGIVPPGEVCPVEHIDERPLTLQIPNVKEEKFIHSPNYIKNYSTPPQTAYSPSAQHQRRQLLDQSHEFTFSTPMPAAVKFQGMQCTPISIQLFVDGTQVQRMLLFPTISFDKVAELIQVKCEKYYKRKIEIGMICYVEARNGDLAQIMKEEDWLKCKYDMRREDFLRLYLIDCTDAGSLEGEIVSGV